MLQKESSPKVTSSVLSRSTLLIASSFWAFLAVSFLLLVLSGCKVEAPKNPLVQTLAVLLFDNESNELDAPDIMQRLVFLALKPSVYQVRERKEVNEFLEKAGIVDGGQLAAIDPVKLGKDLGVQALLFGNVESFGYTNIGFYTERKVKLELKLVDLSNGTVLWERTSGGATRKLTLDKEEAKKNFTSGLADQLADKLFKSPLQEEAEQAAINTLTGLPGFVFAGFAEDEETNEGKQTVRRALKNAVIKK